MGNGSHGGHGDTEDWLWDNITQRHREHRGARWRELEFFCGWESSRRGAEGAEDFFGDDVGKRGKYFLKFRIICIPLQRKWFFNCFRDINKAFKALYLGNQESRKFSLLRQDKVAIDVFGM